MRLRYGRHCGLVLEVLLLRHPDYAMWAMAKKPLGPLQDELSQLVSVFDAHPLRIPCPLCLRAATRVYAYPGQVRLIPRCGACRLFPEPGRGIARTVSTFEAAMTHVVQTIPRGRREAKRGIVRELIRVKGGPARITETRAIAFLESRRSSSVNANESPTAKPSASERPQSLGLGIRSHDVPSPRSHEQRGRRGREL